MFSDLGERISDTFIANDKLSEEKKDIFIYGINRLFSNLIMLTSCLILGILIGEVGRILLFLIFFIPIRKYGGGFHLSSPLACYIASNITVLAGVFTARAINENLFGTELSTLFLILSIIVIFLLTPVESPNKMLTVNEKRVYKNKALKILAVYLGIYVVSAFFEAYMMNSIIAMALFAEGILLIMGKVKFRLFNL